MKIRILNSISYWIYFIKYYPIKPIIFAVSFVSHLMSVVSLCKEYNNKSWLTSASSRVIIAVSTITLLALLIQSLYKWNKSIKNSRIHEDNVETNLQDVSGIVSGKFDYSDYDRLDINLNGEDNNVLFSQKVNEELRAGREISISVDNKVYYKVKDFIRENKDTLFLFLKKKYKSNKLLVNEKKVCLNCDLYPGIKEVCVHKGGYYDTYLTNFIIGKKLFKDINPDDVVADTEDFIPLYPAKSGQKFIKPIEQTNINNQIGASVLGYTKDGYIVTFAQNLIAICSPNSFVPSGSGSADWRDYKLNKGSLNATVKYTMQRELWEECSLKKRGISSPRDVGNIKLIGYFKWLERNGKPEFIGLTKINADFRDIVPESKEVYQPEFCREGNNIKSVADINKFINSYRSERYNTISVPLHVAFIFLEDCIEKFCKNTCGLYGKCKKCNKEAKIIFNT